tara:strand:- start:650 stop:1135 length:486 start_codon:yes stop_codon:yes gene_type:complete
LPLALLAQVKDGHFALLPATDQAHVGGRMQYAASTLGVRRARGDQRLRRREQYVPDAQARRRLACRRAHCGEHNRAAYKAQVGALPPVTLKPAERQRHIRPALETPQAQRAAGLDAAELLAAWAELEVGGPPGRRQAILSTQMILKPAALNRVPELPALHH